ncbi:MAG: hypothetical protein ABIE22_05440 [archaeon]
MTNYARFYSNTLPGKRSARTFNNTNQKGQLIECVRDDNLGVRLEDVEGDVVRLQVNTRAVDWYKRGEGFSSPRDYVSHVETCLGEHGFFSEGVEIQPGENGVFIIQAKRGQGMRLSERLRTKGETQPW